MMHEFAILTWKEWRQHRLSLLFLLILIPVSLFLGAFFFGPTTASGALALLGSAAGGSFLIGLMAFTGELWVGEQRTRGMSFVSRLPSSPMMPILTKWSWALVVPVSLGLYGLAVGYLALILFGQPEPLKDVFVTEKGLSFLLVGISMGFWMLSLGRLLPRTGVGVLLAVLLHVGPIVTWLLFPALLGTRGSFPHPMTLMVPMAILGAALALGLPLVLAKYQRARTWTYAGLGLFTVLSSGSGILNVLGAYTLDPEVETSTLTQTFVGHGERFALLSYSGKNLEKTYLVDLEEEEWRAVGQNYHRRQVRTAVQLHMGIPARRDWTGVRNQGDIDGRKPWSMVLGRVLDPLGDSAEQKARVLDLESGMFLDDETAGRADITDLIARSHRSASDLHFDDGRKLWVGGDGKVMVAADGDDPTIWRENLRVGSLARRGHGLQILDFAPAPAVGMALKAWLDPTREEIFTLPDVLESTATVVLVRRGRWLIHVRDAESVQVQWRLLDPMTQQSEPLANSDLKIPDAYAWRPTRRSSVSALVLTQDDRILYLDKELILQVMDPDTGVISTPSIRGSEPRPLFRLESKKPPAHFLLRLGRSSSGLDAFEVGLSSSGWRCFLFDHERNEIILAPDFEGRLVCLGDKGLYVTQDNHLLRYQFGSDQREVLFPTLEFRENPELGSHPQR